MEGTRDRFGGLIGVDDLDDVLGDVGEQSRVVLLLQGQAAHVAALDMADEQDERDGVVVGGVQRDHGVREAGAAGDYGNPGAAAELTVGEGHVAGPGLVPADDDLHRAATFDEGAGESDVALAGDAEDAVDVVGFEAFDQETGDGPAQSAGLLLKAAGVGRGSPFRQSYLKWRRAWGQRRTSS
jgi:hypothetical protein